MARHTGNSLAGVETINRVESTPGDRARRPLRAAMAAMAAMARQLQASRQKDTTQDYQLGRQGQEQGLE